mgnify:CR=1 FL=1
MWFQFFNVLKKVGQILFGDELVFCRWGFIKNFFDSISMGVHFIQNTSFSLSNKVNMKIFRYCNQPCSKLVGFVVGRNFVESFGERAYGDILGIVFILGSQKLKTVNVVPKSIKEKAKGNLVSFLCFSNIF